MIDGFIQGGAGSFGRLPRRTSRAPGRTPTRRSQSRWASASAPGSAIPQGIFFGGNDMYLTPRQMLRFGQMWLDGGVYRGRRIVPEAWVRESVRPRTTSPFDGHGYGLGWWSRESGGRRVSFAWGYGGQYVFVVPELELVAVFISRSDGPRAPGHLPAIHGILDEFLVPGAAGRMLAPAAGAS